MAFKLNEKTLEPHNGDYIAFLKEIEKGNAKVSGLTVSVNSDMVSSPRTRTPCLRCCALRAA